MAVNLYEHQREALMKMHNGCILCGGVGTGKSRTAIAYYHCHVGNGRLKPEFTKMTDPVDLYIITTARKRDTFEWEKELIPFMLGGEGPGESLYSTDVIIDSWNNIQKYKDVTGAFFIFDEQRVIGKGAWVKAFLQIAKANQWILLSATPGDSWSDYIPVFLANGFYKNRTEFNNRHIVWKRAGNFYKVDRYLETRRLERLRDRILVDMPMERYTEQHHEYVETLYDRGKYRAAQKDRWDPYKNEPIDNAAGLCYILRRIVNENSSRLLAVFEIIEDHPKVIIFYNFDYELDMLSDLFEKSGIAYAEWNGHKHQPIPEGNKWAYLVQYTAGNEGWNCITTNTIIFFSQNYSYKVMTQAAGRIDRLNTPYKDLYYYHLRSKAPIDIAIARAVDNKKTFNEGRYFNRLYKK